MNKIKLEIKNSKVSKSEIENIKPEIMAAQKNLLNKTGVSSNMTGWIEYAKTFDSEEYMEIKTSASYIRENSEVFIVLGIGGSYLGARAAIEAVRGDFHNEVCHPKVYFAGQNLSGTYMKRLVKIIKNKEVSLIVISKSGTTLETALAFRILKDELEKKYHDNTNEHIFVVTDKVKGALKKAADVCKYKTFVIPDNIGGRYSVITPVGLLPMAAAGLDTDLFLKGLAEGEEEYQAADFSENICCQYAAVRNILYRKGKDIEIFAGYEPSIASVSEWLKQLFGESEGKKGQGIFPASLNYTTDLHSMGQLVQEGKRNIFETNIIIDKISEDIIIPEDENNFDGLNYISGKKYCDINKMAFRGTFKAHCDGNVPGIIVSVPEINEYYLGKLFYFFMMTCALSGYTNNVDPFTQPGVEAYKRNMYELLKK